LLFAVREGAMKVPLEITFHGLASSAWVEAEIREQVEKLEKLYPRLVGCRVSLETPHKRSGNICDIHIELRLPGGAVVVNREPPRARAKYANPSVATLLRDAFAAAERQLKDYKHRQSGVVKTHEAMFQGQIAEIAPGEDHGFILTNEGTQLYFHRNAVIDADFAKLKRGDAVHYIASDGDTGPIARKVWLGPDFHMD
jgi:cold shock CspA family protein/ribosome-associated translation inhibitor RaiA